ncbi:MAG: hypothetical protein VW239_01585 [Candidatus Nanopelagicales bacterium]
MAPTHEEKLKAAIEYLRSKGKYVLDEGCKFTPTPYTEKVDILEKYGAGEARLGRVRQG